MAPRPDPRSLPERPQATLRMCSLSLSLIETHMSHHVRDPSLSTRISNHDGPRGIAASKWVWPLWRSRAPPSPRPFLVNLYSTCNSSAVHFPPESWGPEDRTETGRSAATPRRAGLVRGGGCCGLGWPEARWVPHWACSYIAARNGHAAALELLIEAGYDLNAADKVETRLRAARLRRATRQRLRCSSRQAATFIPGR